MANHKDAAKRARQSLVQRLRNRHYRSMMRTRIKAVRDAVSAGDVNKAQANLRDAMSVIHRVARKGIIHVNQAGRRISRLNKLVKNLALGAR